MASPPLRGPTPGQHQASQYGEVAKRQAENGHAFLAVAALGAEGDWHEFELKEGEVIGGVESESVPEYVFTSIDLLLH